MFTIYSFSNWRFSKTLRIYIRWQVTSDFSHLKILYQEKKIELKMCACDSNLKLVAFLQACHLWYIYTSVCLTGAGRKYIRVKETDVFFLSNFTLSVSFTLMYFLPHRSSRQRHTCTILYSHCNQFRIKFVHKFGLLIPLILLRGREKHTWRLDTRRPISIYPFPKWSSAKYIVTKLPDEGMCVPWVQNGDA